MSKHRPATRKHKRVVRSAPPAAPQEPAPEDAQAAGAAIRVSSPERPAPLAARSNRRGLAMGIGLAIIALVALVIAGGGAGGGAPNLPGQESTPAAQADEQIFASIDRSDVQQLMRRGKELYDQSRFEEAAAVYQEAIRLKPDNQAAHSNLGSAYFRLQRLDEALASFREAVRLSPTDAEARQNLGAGLAALGSFDAAIAEYVQAINIKPDLAPAHYSLGVLYQEQGNKAMASDELKRFLEIGTDEQLRSDAQRRLKALGGQ